MQLNFAQITALSMQKLALDSAGDTNIRKTMKAQEEYEKAEASLDYFTKLGPVEYAEQEGFARYNPQTELDMDGINITVEYSVVNIPDQVFNLAVTITRVR